MRRLIFLLAVMGAAVLLATGVALAQSTNQQSSDRGQAPLQTNTANAIPGQYIVVLKDNVQSAQQVANDHARKYGFGPPDFVYERALKGYAVKLSQAQLNNVRSEPQVKYVDVDRKVEAHQTQTDPEYVTGVWRINTNSSTTWQTSNGTTNIPGKTAVIDTGIDNTSGDLNVDTTNAKNCVSTRKNRTAVDDNGHGTHVSGTIGAKHNQKGVVGVAPGVSVVPMKVLNSQGSGTTAQVICGINQASSLSPVVLGTTNGAIRVANMSLGGSFTDPNGTCAAAADPKNQTGYTVPQGLSGDSEHEAICSSVNKGILYVVSAGNGTTDLATQSPASYPEVLTVTALADYDGKSGGTGSFTCRSDSGADDTHATWSNYFTQPKDGDHTIAAPGVCILSYVLNGGTGYKSGTSMAAPHVAGSANLCIANTNAGCTPQDFNSVQSALQKLRSDANTYSTTTNTGYGWLSSTESSKYGYLVYPTGY